MSVTSPHRIIGPEPALPNLFGRTATASPSSRLVTFDAARGAVILLMIFAAAVAALPKGAPAQAMLDGVAAFFTPFVQPALFLIAGIFLHRSMRRPWVSFLPSKVAPLVWRYAFWAVAGTLVAALVRSAPSHGILFRSALRVVVDPPPMLLVVIALAVSLVVLRALRTLPVVLMLPAAAALQIAHPQSGGLILASVAQLFVFLYIGHAFAPEILAFARRAASQRMPTTVAIALWTLINAVAVSAPSPMAGIAHLAQMPVFSLGLGLAGGLAIIAFASLLESEGDADLLQQTGQRGLSLYLLSSLGIEPWRALAPQLPALSVLGLALCGAAAILLVIGIAPRAASR